MLVDGRQTFESRKNTRNWLRKIGNGAGGQEMSVQAQKWAVCLENGWGGSSTCIMVLERSIEP